MTEDMERSSRDDAGQTEATARVLVVVDDPRMDQALSDFLKREGYQVDTAANGVQAAEMLAAARYNLALITVHSGLALWEMIRKQSPNVAVLVVTGYAMIARAEEAVRRGAFDYLVRPIIDDELRATIQRAIRQQTPRSESDPWRRQMGQRFDPDSGSRWRQRRRTSRLRQPPGRDAVGIRGGRQEGV